MSQPTISLPHPLGVCVSRIEAALDEAAGADPMYLSTRAKQEILLALTRVAGRLDGLRLTVMANAGDVAAESGARSIGSWVAHETRVDPPAAAADANLAAALETRYPQVRAGVLAGRVNPAQARVIVSALDELQARIGAELRAEAEARLVAEAAHFDPRRLRVLGRRILDIVAPEVAEDEERRRLEEEKRQARAHTRLFFKHLGAGRAGGDRPARGDGRDLQDAAARLHIAAPGPPRPGRRGSGGGRDPPRPRHRRADPLRPPPRAGLLCAGGARADRPTAFPGLLARGRGRHDRPRAAGRPARRWVSRPATTSPRARPAGWRVSTSCCRPSSTAPPGCWTSAEEAGSSAPASGWPWS